MAEPCRDRVTSTIGRYARRHGVVDEPHRSSRCHHRSRSGNVGYGPIPPRPRWLPTRAVSPFGVPQSPFNLHGTLMPTDDEAELMVAGKISWCRTPSVTSAYSVRMRVPPGRRRHRYRRRPDSRRTHLQQPHYRLPDRATPDCRRSARIGSEDRISRSVGHFRRRGPDRTGSQGELHSSHPDRSGAGYGVFRHCRCRCSADGFIPMVRSCTKIPGGRSGRYSSCRTTRRHSFRRIRRPCSVFPADSPSPSLPLCSTRGHEVF